MFTPTFLNAELSQLWEQLEKWYRIDEKISIENLLNQYAPIENCHEIATKNAQSIIHQLRQGKLNPLRIESLLRTYRLSTQEGLALMCMAEALLRIPDSSTKSRLIRDKLNLGHWKNADETTWVEKLANFSLSQISKFLSIGSSHSALSYIPGLVRRFGEPLIRQIMGKIIHVMGNQFVVAETIEAAYSKKRKRYILLIC